VGGHCIGVDPYYLAHKASSLGHTPQVILSGRHVNDQMGAFVADKLIRLMQDRLIDIADSKVLILGVTFKENCPDIRNSKVFDIHAQLLKKGISVDVFDPFANTEEVQQKYEVELITSLDSYDGIVLAVAHDFFKSLDFNKLLRNKKAVIFDTKAFLDKSIVTARL
jgi:UDP-N-acetyl-D-galactosamine dehydrogenase